MSRPPEHRKRPQRIWHANIGNHAGPVDGVAVMSARLANSQTAEGDEVTYLATPRPDDLAGQQAALAPGVEALLLPSTARLLWRAARRMIRRATRPDVLHCHSVYRPAHVALFLLAKLLRVTTVQAPHSGLAPERLSQGRVPKLVYGLLAEKAVHHWADLVIALQRIEAEDVRRYAWRRRPTEIVANSVEPTLLTEPRWCLEHREDPPVMVLLARYDVYQKGLDLLAGMARKLPSVQFRVYGTQDKNGPGLVQALRREAPPNFSLEPPVHGAEKYETLRAATAFVMPSRVEGLSLALAEAMTLGVPCVVSHYVGESLDMAAEGTAVVLSGDTAADAGALAALVDDPARLARLGARAAAVARERFAPDVVRARTDDAYRQVLPLGR